MQHTSTQSICVNRGGVWVSILVVSVLLPGCSGVRHRIAAMLTGDNPQGAWVPAHNPGTSDDGSASRVDGGSQHGADVDQLHQSAAEHSRRLSEVMVSRAASARPIQPASGAEVYGGVPQVRWLNVGGQVSRDTGQPSREGGARQPLWVSPGGVADSSGQTERVAQAPDLAGSAARAQDNPQQLASSPSSSQAVTMDRQVLLDQLRKLIMAGDDPAITKALATAALSLADTNRPIDPNDLAPLSPAKRKLVTRYHKIISTLADEVAREDGQLEADAVVERVNSLFGERPIRITSMDICRRVRGFGVFDPFESRVFLAGREHPIIVYAELEDFRTIKAGQDRHQVKLSQEVVLYNESDGLAVWQQPQVEIVDESRNQRRDFFVVQMIRLPARLSVGRYLLKVRINDLNGGSLDESTLPIQIVADQALVAGAQK